MNSPHVWTVRPLQSKMRCKNAERSFTISTGLGALAENGAPHIHRILFRVCQQPGPQQDPALLRKDWWSNDTSNQNVISFHFSFTSPFESHPIGQTSTTQGTESAGLLCFWQKTSSTWTSCPFSGRMQDTTCLARPGPQMAEHSPGSDTCHLWMVKDRFADCTRVTCLQFTVENFNSRKGLNHSTAAVNKI